MHTFDSLHALFATQEQPLNILRPFQVNRNLKGESLQLNDDVVGGGVGAHVGPDPVDSDVVGGVDGADDGAMSS